MFGTLDFMQPAGIHPAEERGFEGAAMRIVRTPDGCAEIGSRAFSSCAGLAQIRIPADCTIGESAFEGRENLFSFSVPGNAVQV